MSSEQPTLPGRARLELPPHAPFVRPAVEFVAGFAQQFDRTAGEQESLRAAVSAALEMVLYSNGAGKSEEPIALEVGESGGRLVVELLNRGVPIVVGARE